MEPLPPSPFFSLEKKNRKKSNEIKIKKKIKMLQIKNKERK